MEGRGKKRSLTDDAGIAYTLAQVFIARIVREPPELILHRLRQRRFVHVRVLSLLARKLRVEISHVQHGFLNKAPITLATVPHTHTHILECLI